MTGRLYLIVGNSGSGKDSIIKGVSEAMPKVKVARRFITRAPSEHEDNHYVTKDEFKSLIERNSFFLNWISYDNNYGVSSEVFDWLKKGDDVLVNVSREVVETARMLYPKTKVVFIKAPLEQVLDRIKKRGREDVKGVIARLNRAVNNQSHDYADHVIDNSGDLSTAVKQLCSIIEMI